MSVVRSKANDFADKGFTIRGIPEMDECVLQLRLVLVELIDAINPDQTSIPQVSGGRENTVADSWYQEDHTELRAFWQMSNGYACTSRGQLFGLQSRTE